jgi:PAS domain S-box-containing protein
MNDIFKQYFDSLPCFLTVQDRDLKIIHANKRFVDNFGDYKGRYCYHIYKHRPEKCEICPVERSFRTGQPYYSEEQVLNVDGQEVWVIVNTTPIRDENGEIVSVMEMSTDITEIKQLQQQLKESQERYKLLFDAVPCFISMQDKDLRITEANRLHRETFGTSYGEKCYKVYRHRDKECQPCIVRQTFDDGQIRTHEEVVVSQTDERINVLVRTAPVRDEKGEVRRVLEVGTDISQIRELQDKLTSVGLLISSISHGIKGLLNGLDGGIYLVNSGLQKDDRSRIDRGWEIALRNVDRIRSMVMDILYYAKDREPELEIVSAAEALADVCRIMEDKAKTLRIDFNDDIDPDAGDFEVDPAAFRSLLTNLVENSFDACRVDRKKKSHRVSAKVRGDTDKVIFKIEDNGIGMDRETCDKAFTLFFSSKGAGGTGLGLFISNKIAQAHGGHIKLESEEGKGTRFVVEMPRTASVVMETEPEDGAHESRA